MLAYTYVERGKFALREKPMPVLLDAAYELFEVRRDGVIKVAIVNEGV